jgi:hypothetical protein
LKVIYIAGPFTGPTAWDIAENIRIAERFGLLVAKAGAMPLIPHANTAHFHGQKTPQFWLDGTMELLRRCDGAIFIPRWRQSSGAKGEFSEAGYLSIPSLKLDEVSVFNIEAEIDQFVRWLEHGQDNKPEEYRAVD